ncbi:MAG: FliA/WhiG family RNA polymerase sigma factor [Verrucomicrobiales bacterium]|nr:FliA/WhiG family RNA polymerase sigma factor [Verrucomicrobiales bacterium]
MKCAPSPIGTLRSAERAKSYVDTVRKATDEGELIQQYLPLVKTVVSRLAMTLPSHVDVEDLHSYGQIGLLNAIRKFDPHAGSSFESYARVRIRGAILDELRKLDWVPRSVHKKARQVQDVIQQLMHAKGEIPSNLEVAQALRLSVSEYEELLDEIRPAVFVCLDSVGEGDRQNEGGAHESIADESQPDPSEVAAKREWAGIIADVIAQLPAAQKRVLALYYFEDLRLREIAEVLGLSEARICQIHAQGILSIRAHLQSSHSATLKQLAAA